MCYGDSAGKRCIDITGHSARLVPAYMDAAAAAESYTTAWQRIALTTSKPPRCAVTTCGGASGFRAATLYPACVS